MTPPIDQLPPADIARTLYAECQRLHGCLLEAQWSRRLTRRDYAQLHALHGLAQGLSNHAYWLTQKLPLTPDS